MSTIAGVRLRFAANQFQIISGIRRASSDCASSVTGGSGVARKGSLYILTEPRADLALGVDACQVVQQTIAREYYADPSPSSTTSLTHALARANLALLEHNRHAQPSQRAQVGVSCAVLRGDEAYIAHLPPAQAYLVHQGQVRAFPSPRHWPAAGLNAYPPASLGANPADPDPDLALNPLQSGDAVILCSSNLAALFSEADALEHFIAADQYQVVDYLHELAMQARLSEAYALVIVAEADEGKRAAHPSGEHPLPPAPDVAAPKRKFGLPFTLPAINLPHRQAEPPPAEYQPSPIPLRGGGPAPHVTIDRTDGQGWDDDLPSLSHAVAPPPRDPRIDNLIALRDRRADPPAAATLRPDVPDEDGIAFTAPAPHPSASTPQPPADYLLADDEDWLPVDLPESTEQLAPVAAVTVGPTIGQRLTALREAASVGASKLGKAAIPLAARLRTLTRRDQATSDYPAEQRVDYADTAARRAPRAVVDDDEDYDDEVASPPQTRRVPMWAVAAALVVIVAVLVFSITSAMGAQKSKQISDLLTQAGAAMGSAQSSADKSAQHNYLTEALSKLDEAAKLNPNDAGLRDARRRWQMISDNVNLVTRLSKPQLLFELQASTATTATGSYLSQVLVEGNDAFMLDRGAGALYRYKLGSNEPAARVLASGDSVKGKLIYITWRVDVVLALDDLYNAYLYNPATEQTSVITLGGSDTLARPLDIASFDGNLYILGAKANQIIKYSASHYDAPPSDWLTGSATGLIGGASKMAVDGSIYVLTNNSRILRFSGGKLDIQADPNAGADAVYPPATAPHGITTSAANQYLYTIEASGGSPDGSAGRIIRFSKDGKLLQQYMAEVGSSVIADLRTAFVSPDDATLYLLTATRLYRVPLPTVPVPSAPGAPTPTLVP